MRKRIKGVSGFPEPAISLEKHRPPQGWPVIGEPRFMDYSVRVIPPDSIELVFRLPARVEMTDHYG